MNMQAVNLLWCCAHICDSLGLQDFTLFTITKKKNPKGSFPEVFCLFEHMGVS